MFWRVKVLGSESELVKAVGAPSALMTMRKGVLAAGPSLLWGEVVRGYQQWKLQPQGLVGWGQQKGRVRKQLSSGGQAVCTQLSTYLVSPSHHGYHITIVLCLSGD